MRVDFLGIPGAGKTSLMNSVARVLKNDGLQIVTREMVIQHVLSQISKLSHKTSRLLNYTPEGFRKRALSRLFLLCKTRDHALTRFISNYPELSLNILKIIDESHPKQKRAHLARWFADLFSLYQVSMDAFAGEDIFLIDESFTNRALTLFGYQFCGQSIALLHDYLSCIPAPDLVVMVDVPIEVAEERIVKRRLPNRMKDMNQADRMKALMNNYDCVCEIEAFLSSKGVLLSRFLNTGSVQKTSQDIVQQIKITENSIIHNK